MTIYEYDKAIEGLIDPETGEVSDYEAFLSLAMERDTKIENVAVYVKELEARARAIRTEELSLKSRREPLERRANRLRDYLAQYLDGSRFDCPRASLSFRKSTALEVTDVTSAVDWLESSGHVDMVVRGAPTVDKRAVTALVKGGVDVPGVGLVTRNSLQVR